MRHALTLAAAAAFAVTLAAAPAAVTPALAQQQTESFSDDQLRSYAAAALQVHAIGSEYQPQIERAESDQQAEQLRLQANEEMVDAVQQQGLTVDEYNQIFTAAQTDTQVRSAVEEHMRAAQ